MKSKLPGTLWKSHGAWHWRVQFPGKKRQDITLINPLAGTRLPESASIGLAESIAWKVWEKTVTHADVDGVTVFTVNDLCDKWTAHAKEYYRDADGNPTSEVAGAALGVRPFRQLFGTRPIEGMLHKDMLDLREKMIADGQSRVTINKYLGMVKRMVRWGLDTRLVSAQASAELTQIANLKANRSQAREPKPIVAVPDETIEATCKRLMPSVADMVRVHRLTGMRPAEACQLCWEDIERRPDVWIFRPGKHKNLWRNQPRVVVIGPRAQAILSKYAVFENKRNHVVSDDNKGYVFSPERALLEHYEAVKAAAKCHRPAKKLKGAPRKVGEAWTPTAYAKALRRACEALNLDSWHPNQLRHTCATEIRRKMGLDAARAVLGHTDTRCRITDRYSFEAAADEAILAATPAMLALG